MHNKNIFSLVVLFLIGTSIFSQISIEQENKIDSIASQTFEGGNFPGMAVAIAVKDKVIWSKGYGYANIESKKKIDPASSIFRIGSISKTLASAALVKLVEKKKIDLDAEVQDYVPYFPTKKWPLTVRQIACHTGGIRHYQGMEFLSNIDFKDVQSGINIFKDSDLNFEPGTKYSYSTYGWNLTSAAIEGAAQIPFLKFMQENVFDPLDMNETYAEKANLDLPNRVTFYSHNNNEIVIGLTVNNSNKWAGGGFLSTTSDLVKFSYGIQQNKLYGESYKQESWKSCKLDDGTINNYGLAWATNTDDDGRKWVGHSGGSMGGTSMYLLYPEEELTVITLVNLSSAQMNRLAFRIAKILLDSK